jgi:hypothetical protein
MRNLHQTCEDCGTFAGSVVLSRASCCQLQRAPLGKGLKLKHIFSIYRPHTLVPAPRQ